ncbi:MAG TPA: acetylornithine transaminase [Acidobacteriota bacterium]|nr:acetylornithine transaminase [Acidobacteriota bacterium]
MKPQADNDSIIRIEDASHLDVYKRYPLVIERGQDVWVYDNRGRRYLDLYGGHAVCAVGHCNPRVVEAVQRQAGRLIFYSNLVYNPARASAAAKLVEAAPRGLDKVFFINSGAEANENALKLARMTRRRPGILSFNGSFHGRTMGALSATGMEKMRAAFQPNLPHHHFVDFGDLEAVERVLSGGDVAGVILEPVQSLGGVDTAPPEFFRGLRRLCDQAGSLLIYDEVQTGFGRTGTLFYAGRHGVLPDIVTLAKGMAGGLPMGAVLCAPGVSAQLAHGDLGSTFGGNPLVCAAMQATLEAIQQEGLLDNVVRQHRYLAEGLQRVPGVKRLRGEGFLIGIEFETPAAAYQQKLLQERILTGLSGNPNVLRLLPPLTLQAREIDHFLRVLAS